MGTVFFVFFFEELNERGVFRSSELGRSGAVRIGKLSGAGARNRENKGT